MANDGDNWMVQGVCLFAVTDVWHTIVRGSPVGRRRCFVYTSDVLVRSNGNIEISGDADGNPIQLVKRNDRL